MTPVKPGRPFTEARCSVVAGLDLLTTRQSDADHLVHQIADEVVGAVDDAEITVATHWAQVGLLRHVALSVQLQPARADDLWPVLQGVVAQVGGPSGVLLDGWFAGEPELRTCVGEAVNAHRTQRGGRVVVFPGSASLVGTLPVSEALRLSAIDRILVLGQGDADHAASLTTRDFIRPRWDTGQLVLDVQHAAGGTLVPFETPTPTPCCADHI